MQEGRGIISGRNKNCAVLLLIELSRLIIFFHTGSVGLGAGGWMVAASHLNGPRRRSRRSSGSNYITDRSFP